MSEIETREGVDLLPCPFCDAPLNRETGMGDHWYEHPAADGKCWLSCKIIPDLAAWNARTPAQTQTFKDGLAAGLEAAAKVAEELQCRTCGAWFHPNVNPHYDEDCPKGRASWDGARFNGDIPTAIRALKEPS